MKMCSFHLIELFVFILTCCLLNQNLCSFQLIQLFDSIDSTYYIIM